MSKCQPSVLSRIVCDLGIYGLGKESYDLQGKNSMGMDRAGWGSHDHPFGYARKKAEENRWDFLSLEKN